MSACLSFVGAAQAQDKAGRPGRRRGSRTAAGASCDMQAADKKLNGGRQDQLCQEVRKGHQGRRDARVRDQAVDKNGKALAGAAKTSFMKKCEADAAKG